MKKSYPDMIRDINVAEAQLGVGSLWRHKGGGIYEVQGVEIDSDDGELRVVYSLRAGPEVDLLTYNPVKFSRPIREWTLDRFVRLA